MIDHALGKQTFKRLFDVGAAHFLQRAGEEARVQKMQNGMLNTADIGSPASTH